MEMHSIHTYVGGYTTRAPLLDLVPRDDEIRATWSDTAWHHIKIHLSTKHWRTYFHPVKCGAHWLQIWQQMLSAQEDPYQPRAG